MDMENIQNNEYISKQKNYVDVISEIIAILKFYDFIKFFRKVFRFVWKV